jgi:prephenate dehydrogenase
MQQSRNITASIIKHFKPYLKFMTTCIIGLGLIGGSMGYALQKHNIATHIIGVDSSESHAQKALEMGFVNEILPLEKALEKATLIIMATPVNIAMQLLPTIMENALPQAIIFDMGSTKQNICNLANTFSNRPQFVATHPMWGTENSGPTAALKNAFVGKAVVICEAEKTNETALNTVKNIYETIGMHIVYMQAESHDVHTAYVSHISHITSFALANTVLEKEREDDAIFELASGGFESTVRLAKSNANMWVPIFMQNRENVLDVLNEHIAQLKKFKSCLEKENDAYLFELIEKANKIKQVLEK